MSMPVFFAGGTQLRRRDIFLKVNGANENTRLIEQIGSPFGRTVCNSYNAIRKDVENIIIALSLIQLSIQCSLG